MGLNSAAAMDAWLLEGRLVVASSDRAARAIASNFHRARQADGLAAWPAPNVLPWQRFVRTAWENRAEEGCLVLSAVQEQSVWTRILEASGNSAALLDGPRHRLAAMAMGAHDLLSSYAPKLLRPSARNGWHQDAAEFSKWLRDFDDECRFGSLLSASRLPNELIPLLEADRSPREPLLLAGFDRLLPIQRSLFDAWGDWRESEQGSIASDVRSFIADDRGRELAACAQWCAKQLRDDPHKRLLVIASDASQRRGEFERTFLRYVRPSEPEQFEFSLGVPLNQVPLARSAHLVLRWLGKSIEEHELDWLFHTGYAASSAMETASLQAFMRALRRRGLERTEWSFNTFAGQQIGANRLPLEWVQRMTEAQRMLELPSQRTQHPLDWAGLVSKVLEVAGWPGYRPLSSAEFQAARRLQQAVDTCGSLGFDGRSTDWKTFLSELERILHETLFALESQNAPIVIAGPAESAGLTADAIWFLGATEEAWPARGSTHPLLPIEVQRKTGMPHATPQLDWDLTQAITTRLISSASEVRFSCALQNEGVESKPSRVINQVVEGSEPVPLEFAPEPDGPALTILVEDASRIPLPSMRVAATSDFEEDTAKTRGIPGGSTVLTSQSQCPFKAFSTARLAAKSWEPAETGLSASMRGQLLHGVMHAIWSGPPKGIRSLDQLRAQTDRAYFIAGHVRRVLRDKIPAAAREQMPRRYLELEEERLIRVVSEWLEYELTRQPFEVATTEAEKQVTVDTLALNLRLDRIDRLNDGSLLVIDYKTGDVSTASWELPRPDDVQLPLYAGFALEPEEVLGGLVFAKIRAGKHCFTGRVGDARATLLGDLGMRSALVKDALTAEQLIDWRDAIEQLARDFVSGRADVNPGLYPETCKRCGLQTLCRILESRNASTEDDDSGDMEATDE